MIPKIFLKGQATLNVCTQCNRIKKFAFWVKPTLTDVLRIQDGQKDGRLSVLETICEQCQNEPLGFA